VPCAGERRAIVGIKLTPYRVLGLTSIVCLAACVSGVPKKSPDHAAAPIVKINAADSKAAQQRLAAAIILIDNKHTEVGFEALQLVLESPTFDALAVDDQYRALSIAVRVAPDVGRGSLGYEYLVRLVAMPQSTPEDRVLQVQTAYKFGDKDDAVQSLTLLAQRWPDRIGDVDSRQIIDVVDAARQMAHGEALTLLQALYAARWKLRWTFEPDVQWRYLALLLIEKGQMAQAIEVSRRIDSAYILIAMRADLRFDALVAANPASFDVYAAGIRELRSLESVSAGDTRSLFLQNVLISLLEHQRHYPAMLAASDSVLSALESTNFPEKLYRDYLEQYAVFLNLRSQALQRNGRWDAAIAQLSAIKHLPIDSDANVSTFINLGALYCKLGRPQDAVITLRKIAIVSPLNPFGAMQLELVRLWAAVELGDKKQIALSLQYLSEHRQELPPDAYWRALVMANDLDKAAELLIAQLSDKDRRLSALESVQIYMPPPGTRVEMNLEVRLKSLIARHDVQTAIAKVGRIDSYNLERR
jgi:tetratricopeptide (TPR) repeat protein